jgi:hypothetical protein
MNKITFSLKGFIIGFGTVTGVFILSWVGILFIDGSLDLLQGDFMFMFFKIYLYCSMVAGILSGFIPNEDKKLEQEKHE